MTALTRRRVPEVHQETWRIFFDDVCVGTIGERAGVPVDVDQWSWSLGFYPKSHRPGGNLTDTAETFDLARAAFEQAWDAYLPTCTEQDFLDYRQQRAWTAWKYAMHDLGKPLPTQMSSGRSRCFCGTEITIKDTFDHVYECHIDMGRE